VDVDVDVDVEEDILIARNPNLLERLEKLKKVRLNLKPDLKAALEPVLELANFKN
tara:strand:+ start:40 stop:204 length:165 start_codon:yes stop_codon:yes gene_type:complete